MRLLNNGMFSVFVDFSPPKRVPGLPLNGPTASNFTCMASSWGFSGVFRCLIPFFFFCCFLCSKSSEKLPYNVIVKVYHASHNCDQLSPFQNESSLLFGSQYVFNLNQTWTKREGCGCHWAMLTTQRVDATLGEIPSQEAGVHSSAQRGRSHQGRTFFNLRTGCQGSSCPQL